jgi:hypothetical protein
MAPTRAGTLDPAPPKRHDGGGGGRWAWLLTAGGIVEAELVRGLLEQAGVPVVLDRRDPSPFAWMYLAGNVNAPVQLYVPAALLDSARLLLLEAGFSIDTEPAPPPAMPATQRRPHVGIRWILVASALVVALWILLVTFFGSATCMLRVVC